MSGGAMAGDHETVAEAKLPLLPPTSHVRARARKILSARNLALAAGPLSTLIIILTVRSLPDPEVDGRTNHKMGAMLGVLVWMALWWILGPIPIAITSLLPLGLFPFLKIMDSDTVSAEYTNSVVVLLLGTFILALGIQKHDLHKRIALKILLTTGGEEMNARFVMLGFLAAATFVSMWMSDTVAAVMMIPVAVGLLNSLYPKESDIPGPSPDFSASSSSSPLDEEEVGAETEQDGSSQGKKKSLHEEAIEREREATAIAEYCKGLILAVTYGTALGGMATLVGSGPNTVLPGFYHEVFPDATGLDFFDWCKFCIPMLIPFVIATWLYLIWTFCPASTADIVSAKMDRRLLLSDYAALGPISFPEKVILSEFFVLVVLWITRAFGASPGWGALFDDFPSDGTVALLAAITLFIIPNKRLEGEMMLDWKSCKELSWNVILVVGGGFALSKGIQVSGLSSLIGEKLEFLGNLPFLLVTPVITTILSIVTEFSSNVSVASLFLPILAEVALTLNLHPLLLMVPATFACNFSFILPSATPPNAIALGSGRLKIRDMMRPGLFMHIVGLVLISVFTPTLGVYVFGLNRPL